MPGPTSSVMKRVVFARLSAPLAQEVVLASGTFSAASLPLVPGDLRMVFFRAKEPFAPWESRAVDVSMATGGQARSPVAPSFVNGSRMNEADDIFR